MSRFTEFLKKRVVACFLGIFALIVGLFLFSFLLTLSLRWVDPPTSAFMLQHKMFGKGKVQQRWVSYSRISPRLPIAVVAAEDQKFPEHFGFDLESILDAINAKKSRKRGASTITQQLAKNLFLWPGRSLLRKDLEAYFAVLIELTWSKSRILEVYLNVVEFGPGIYGAEVASKTFFNKPAAYLTAHEAALLVAVLPNPNKMSARNPSQYVLRRVEEIDLEVRRLGGASYLSEL